MSTIGQISRGIPLDVRSLAADAAIGFGVAVQPGTNKATQAKAYAGGAGTKQVQTLTFNAALIGAATGVYNITAAGAFVADNVATIKVNGRTMDSVSWASTSDAMMTAVAASIAEHEKVASAVVTSVGGTTEDDRVIVVTAANPGEVLTITVTVTGGAGQTTFSQTAGTPAGTNNTINGKIDGVAIEPVTFNTSNNQTIADLITELLEQENVLSATASDVGSVGYHNTITITTLTPGSRLVLSNFAVTGGATQATIAVAQTVAPVWPAEVIGVSLFDLSKSFTRNADGDPAVTRSYPDGAPCAVVKKGTIWVTAGATIAAQDKAAVIKVAGAGDPVAGSFVPATYVNGAGGSIETFNGRFLTAGAALAAVELEVNIL